MESYAAMPEPFRCLPVLCFECKLHESFVLTLFSGERKRMDGISFSFSPLRLDRRITPKDFTFRVNIGDGSFFLAEYKFSSSGE